MTYGGSAYAEAEYAGSPPVVVSTAPFLDAAELYPPTQSEPIVTIAPFLDGGFGFPGYTVVATAATAATGPPLLQLIAGGNDILGDVDRPEFRDEIADTGTFEFTMPTDLFDASGLDYDDIIRFRVRGRNAFLGIVEALDPTTFGAGDEADMTTLVKGRGGLGVLELATVRPSRGPDVNGDYPLPIEEVRSLSWVSVDFDHSAWPRAKAVNRQRNYANWAGPFPWLWPDTTAYWIWANLPSVSSLNAPSGFCLFWKTFTLTEETRVRIYAAADNTLRLFVDAAELQVFTSYRTGRYVDITLGAGTHSIAARCLNSYSTKFPNPGGLICAVYEVAAANDLLGKLITHTDTTWQCLPYPTRAPGFTHGKAIRILLEENQGSGGPLDQVTLDFTDTLDSAGRPWPYYREISVKIGRSLLEVLRELSDTYIDMCMMPGTLKLQVFGKGRRGRTVPVALQQTDDPNTSDYNELKHAGRKPRVDEFIIRYGGGQLLHTRDAAVIAHGLRSRYLELGVVDTASEAIDIADELMDILANESVSTFSVLDPHEDENYPVTDRRRYLSFPYVGYRVADRITGLDKNADPELQRIRAITMRMDGDGNITWPTELRDPIIDQLERHETWLRRMDDGAMVGGARVSSPAGTPQPVEAQITALIVHEFSTDNVQLVAGISGKRPAQSTGNGVEIFGKLTTVGGTPTTAEVYMNGNPVGGLIFLAGEDEDETPLNILPIRANVDSFQVAILEPGFGAKGLNVQVRAI